MRTPEKALAGLITALERKAEECDIEKWHTQNPDSAVIAAAKSSAFLEAASMARQCLMNVES